MSDTVRSVDLADCAREPIHVPGFVQEFGVLLALPSGGFRISQISSNTDLVFGLQPSQVIGRRLADVVGGANASEITAVLAEGNWKEKNPLKMSIMRNGTPFPVNVIVHRYDGLDFVEIEPLPAEAAGTAARSFHLVQGSLLRLQNTRTAEDLWEAVVAEVHRITGFDRVMVYKFDRDEHGHVIAEHKRDHHNPFLGLHYPASDIPEQARRLYRLNWIRYIPDIHYASRCR